MTFDTLGLSADLLQTVAEEGYTTPTPVQAAAIPLVLEGRDVLAAAQTGTGKTAAFTLPDPRPPPRRTPTRRSRRPATRSASLILVPTRELAMQVDESVRTYGRTVPLRSTVVYGGIPMDPQIKALRAGVEILVATPGRLLDLVGQKVANLGQVEILVLDEADRMLDMGFLPDIQRIIELLPKRRQNLMFSATFSDDIRRLSGTILRDPETVEVAPAQHHGRGHPPARLSGRPRPQGGAARPPHPQGDLRQVLVFTRTKLAASRLASRLDRDGIDAVAIHSDRSQPERTRALEGFKSGDIRVLVATDVAARGLDIEDLPVVVNFELPWNPQDYIHRIGRTGRAGATGEAISLVCIDEVDLLRGIQRMLKQAIPWTVEEGFVPDRNGRAAAARDARRATPVSAASTMPAASRSGRDPEPGSGRLGTPADGAVAAVAQVGPEADDRLGRDGLRSRRSRPRRPGSSRRPGRRSPASGRPRRARRHSG